MRHWPKPLHLVLISRINPPMPLAGLRAKGMLNEIRTRDLRFTSQETETYLSQSQLVHIDQSALQLLDERFEGWPAGLHLAALSLRSAAGKESVLSAISGENSNITGYLLDEVLTHQLPAIHTFLLKTSILDRFCAPLCEAIIGESDTAWNVRACLDWIERSELFIIPLDDRREWYRYHHLFQELLQQRLSAEMTPDQVNTLHRQASAWFEEHGLLDEAMQHALAAGDLDLAARQMNSGLRDVLNREDRPTLERWLRQLPEEVVQRTSAAVDDQGLGTGVLLATEPSGTGNPAGGRAVGFRNGCIAAGRRPANPARTNPPVKSPAGLFQQPGCFGD